MKSVFFYIENSLEDIRRGIGPDFVCPALARVTPCKETHRGSNLGQGQTGQQHLGPKTTALGAETSIRTVGVLRCCFRTRFFFGSTSKWTLVPPAFWRIESPPTEFQASPPPANLHWAEACSSRKPLKRIQVSDP